MEVLPGISKVWVRSLTQTRSLTLFISQTQRLELPLAIRTELLHHILKFTLLLTEEPPGPELHRQIFLLRFLENMDIIICLMWLEQQFGSVQTKEEFTNQLMAGSIGQLLQPD